jgi:hypothetical protein
MGASLCLRGAGRAESLHEDYPQREYRGASRVRRTHADRIGRKSVATRADDTAGHDTAGLRDWARSMHGLHYGCAVADTRAR